MNKKAEYMTLLNKMIGLKMRRELLDEAIKETDKQIEALEREMGIR